MPEPFVLSYPGPTWTIRGAANFKSQGAGSANAGRALREWLTLADAIHESGREIAVVPPPDSDPPLTGLIYPANHGALFGDLFLVSRMHVEHRRTEHEVITSFFRHTLGIEARVADNVWEGQADMTVLPDDRYLLTWGVRTVQDACLEVRRLLPNGSATRDIQLRDPYFHGDTCLSLLPRTGGRDPVLLVFAGGMVDTSLDDLRELHGVEIIEITEADALGYACNALALDDTLLAPAGLSSELKTKLTGAGFRLVELDLSEVFGKGGGGPRCLVNQLRGFDGTIPDTVRYAAIRDELHSLSY